MSNDTDKNTEQHISELYNKLDKQEPSEATDEAILNYAKHRTAISNNKPFMSQHYRWLSIAASVMLVSVIFISQWQNFTPEGIQEIPADSTPIVRKPAENQDESVTGALAPMADVLAERAVEPPENRARMASKAEDVQKVQVTGSRLLTVPDNAIKPECRYSLDGANPLSESVLGKYIQNLDRRTQQALVIAINNNIPLASMLEETPSLAKPAEMPGFAKHYEQLANQVRECVVITGPAVE